MKEIRLGLIGTGKISTQLADAARAAGGFRLSAVLSRDPARGAAFAKENGIACAYAEEEAFYAAGLDAVYVATPNSCHAHYAIAAAAHGLHVLCEKPVAADREEWAAMRRAADAHGVVLLEAMRPLHDPLMPLLQRELPALGRLRHVRLEYCQYSSRYDAFRAGQVLRAFTPAYANAAVMDIGVYCVAVAAYLFGMPQKVQATSVFLENGFEGGGEALLAYPGFTVSLGYSKITASVAPSCFLGEDGALTVDRLNAPTRVLRCPRPGAGEGGDERRGVLFEKSAPHPAKTFGDGNGAPGGMGKSKPAPAEIRLPYTPTENNMVYELRDFADLIARGETAHRWQEASDITIRILDEIRRVAGIRFS